jgi:RNA methyltransferase, TrmH family
MAGEPTAASTKSARVRTAERADPLGSSGSETIRSRENRRLKLFRAALRGGGPSSGGPIAVEGPKLVQDGLRAGLQLDALLISESGERHLDRMFQAARETVHGIPRSQILRTTNKLFAGVSGTETPQGVAALFRQREWTLDDVLRGVAEEGAFRGDPALVIVLAGVQDPGNVGTIVRSAEAFGATGIIATRGTADPWSPKAVRASAGSALRLPLIRGIAAPVVLAQLRMAGVRIYAAVSGAEKDRNGRDEREEEGAGTPLVDADLSENCAIVIGSEGQGLPPEIERAADQTVSVPISDDVDSLNAAVAASVLLYEASRRRRPVDRRAR